MSADCSFPSKRKFVDWMLEEANNARGRLRRVAIGYEPIACSVRAAPIDGDDLPEWADRVVELPLSKAALGRLWDTVQEANHCLFFRHDGWLSNVIVVAARAGAWKSLDERSLATKKDSFHEISDEEARSLIGDKTACNSVVAEVQLFGIGCRVLDKGRQP